MKKKRLTLRPTSKQINRAKMILMYGNDGEIKNIKNHGFPLVAVCSIEVNCVFVASGLVLYAQLAAYILCISQRVLTAQ